MASEGLVYQGEIEGGAWVDAQHLKVGDQLLTDGNQWQKVKRVEINSTPLDVYNLTVDDYSTFFVAGARDASAVWVHNTCYDKLSDGFQPTGRTTSYGQPTFVDAIRNILYRGNDGRYYDINDHPPCPKADDNLARPEPNDA